MSFILSLTKLLICFTYANFIHVHGVHFLFEPVAKQDKLKDNANKKAKDNTDQIIILQDIEIEANDQQEHNKYSDIDNFFKYQRFR
jgi:hypothetical protein